MTAIYEGDGHSMPPAGSLTSRAVCFLPHAQVLTVVKPRICLILLGQKGSVTLEEGQFAVTGPQYRTVGSYFRKAGVKGRKMKTMAKRHRS